MINKLKVITNWGRAGFLKRIGKEGIGLGPGTHIWKFRSGAIEAPGHKLNTCTKSSHQKCDWFWTRSSGWEI